MKLVFLTYFLGIGILCMTSVSGHKWQSAYILQNSGREIDYYLEKNQIYGSIISPGYKAGYHLRVGQVWEEVIGTENHQVDCERIYGDDVYLDEYKPVTYFYQDTPYFAYTFINKQVWNCSSSKMKAKSQKVKDEPPINFYRIVSVVHGIRPVNTIFYFDGIEVISDTTSDESRQGYESMWTATLKEIKYMNPSTKKVLRYDGKLSLLKGAEDDPLSLFVPVDVHPETEFHDDSIFVKCYRTENLGPIEKTLKTQVIGTEGVTLRVGTDRFTTLGKKDDTAKCELQLEKDGNVPYLYTDQYLPKCSICKPKSDVDDPSYGGPVDNVSGNCFSVMKQELWECTFETLEATKDGKGTEKVQKTFKRRVTELVGAIPIAKIEYYSGEVSVWKYKLDSKSSSVRIKEIYYYKDNFHDQIRFNGAVLLRKPPYKENNVKQEDAFLYSYNSTEISVYPKISGENAKKPVIKQGDRLIRRSSLDFFDHLGLFCLSLSCCFAGS